MVGPQFPVGSRAVLRAEREHNERYRYTKGYFNCWTALVSLLLRVGDNEIRRQESYDNAKWLISLASLLVFGESRNADSEE